jgi:hypothetical protein
MYKYHERTQVARGLEVSSSLGALSQMTMEKDEIEKFEFVDSSVELQKRLQELEDITLSFLLERYFIISSPYFCHHL